MTEMFDAQEQRWNNWCFWRLANRRCAVWR